MVILRWMLLLGILHGSASGESCGDIKLSRTKRRIQFPGDSRIPINDGEAGGRGSGCDMVINELEGWIFSPNYPANYDDHRTCSYVIRKYSSDICKVEMKIIDFDLEESDGCYGDYLSLEDAQQGRLCGSLASGTKKTLSFPPGQQAMTLWFRSDGRGNRKGFMIQIKQIPNSCRDSVEPIGYCDRIIGSISAEITSPGYPNGYPPNQRCTYTVRRYDRGICEITVAFRDFQLERGDRACVKDYLEFSDGTRICGRSLPRKRTLYFSRGRDDLLITFVSNGYETGRGFVMDIEQIPNSCGRIPPPLPDPRPPPSHCDQTISTPSGQIVSPGFPRPYGPNERCRYTIRRADPSVCKIEIQLRKFDVTYSNSRCTKDYLQLPDLTRICGVLSGRKVLGEFGRDDYVSLYFVSGEFSSGRGFYLYVNQLFGSCPKYPPPRPTLCDQEVATQIGKFTSPRYPSNYGSNARCIYTVRRRDSNTCMVELDFKYFDVEESLDGSCSQDFLQLPDNSKLCGQLSGSKILQFQPGRDLLKLYFFSNGYGSRRGFEIEVRQHPNSCSTIPRDCNQEIRGSTGRLTSPGFPQFYGAELSCRYTIYKLDSTTCLVELDFQTFDLEYSENCELDYLEMPDRSRECGTYPNRVTKTFDFSAFPDDRLTLFFSTGTSKSRKGFDIIVRQLPNSCGRIPTPVPTPPDSCGGTFASETSIITSPNYPSNYPANIRCVYVIRPDTDSTCQVRLEFIAFDVESSPDCSADFLEIPTTAEKFCGFRSSESKVLMFPSGSRFLELIFMSDRETSRPGFEIKMTQLHNSCYRPIVPDPTTTECGVFSEAEGYIQSENFPRAYNPDSYCVYRIQRSSRDVCQLELYFVNFDVGTDSGGLCEHDYVEITGTRYCGRRDGQRVLIDFPASQNEVTVIFKTDGFDENTGFRIQIKQLTSGCSQSPPESCDHTLTGETLQIISPGYQQGAYPPNSECRYVIKKSSFDVCALEVKYLTFDLEESPDCQKDYLDIAGQKLCGRVEYDSTRTYEFPEDEMIIRFHSDDFTNGAGFFLNVKQVKC